MPDLSRASVPPPSDIRRRFPAWSAPRASLPPIAVPTGARRRRHLPVGTDVPRARNAVRVCLDDWGVTPTAVVLVVSELLTHAVHRENAHRVDAELVDQGTHVTVVVEYDLPAPPDAAPTEVAPVTLGLTVVGRVADRWGRAAAGRRARLWAVVPVVRVDPTSAATPTSGHFGDEWPVVGDHSSRKWPLAGTDGTNARAS